MRALLLASGVALSSAAQARIPVLNRVTFDGNVKDGAAVEHWFVMFCVDWYEPCEELRPSYLDHAASYESHLNADALLSLPVRFAEVDCAVDKVLCNRHSVEMYPQVIHYHRGEQVAAWSFMGGKKRAEAKKMAAFMQTQTDFSKAQTDAVDSALPAGEGDAVLTAFRLLPGVSAVVVMGAWTLTVILEALERSHCIGRASAKQTSGQLQTTTSPAGAPTETGRRGQQWSVEL